MKAVVGTIKLERGWKVARLAGGVADARGASLAWVEAAVPGSVHYDLVRAGLLDNPFRSTASARAAEWVADSDWLFVNRFDADAAGDVSACRAVLTFQGVDTYADVTLNGELVGSTQNAYRAYSFELRPGLLRARGNELAVHVKAHGRMITDKAPAAKRMGREGAVTGLLGKSLIRRYQRNFYAGSSLLNLGTGVLGIGINKPVSLELYPGARIADWHARVASLTDDEATVTIGVDVDGGGDLGITATLREPGGAAVAARAQARLGAGGRTAELRLTVARPRRWWPAGYGEQPLYGLTLELAAGGVPVDVVEARLGLRQVKLVTEVGGKTTFQLQVNGRRIHCRGYNPIPLDYVKVHGEWPEYQRLLELVKASGANIIRQWGGGAMEDDRYYELCDELGIMVWQDFFLHSNVYPDYDPEWVEEFRQECVKVTKRLRNHPCLAMICGGNEQQEGWDEWGWKDDMDRFYGEPLVRELLPRVAAEHCPDLPYVFNSPHGRNLAQSPVDGDMHCWGNFYNSTKDPTFVTESCWNLESYSRPQTLLASMGLDVDRLDQPGWHREWTRLTGLPLINRFPFSTYFNVSSLRGYLHALEVEHALADHHAFSNLRLRSPSCNGILYWSLNKGGPLFGFGCIDYHGVPLMSYYVTRRLWAPVVVGLYRDVDDIRVMCSNESIDELKATLRVRHLKADGTVLGQWATPVTIPSGRTVRVQDIAMLYAKVSDRLSEVVHAGLFVGDRLVSDETLFFCPFAEYARATAPLAVTASRSGPASWTLAIEATQVCKMVEIETEARVVFTDNYFALTPGVRRTIEMSSLAGAPLPAFVSVGVVDGEPVRVAPR
jgi:beta-mannosidase